MKTTDCPAYDLRIIASLTPFKSEELIGERFKNGNMLGGAHPLAAVTPVPVINKQTA